MQAGRSAVELAVYPLFALIHQENLGDPHPVLAGGERYVSHRFAGEGERWLRAELAEAGVHDRGQLADFIGMLSIVQRARTEFYGWVKETDESYAVLAAAHGHSAFALTRHGDRVRFERTRSDRLAEALVRRLPDVPPGRGKSISVPEAEVTRSGPRPMLRRASGAALNEQTRRLDGLFRAPPRGLAKLYAAHRDDAGNRVRSRQWLDLIDTVDGRWAVYSTAGRGERMVNAVPATPRLVTEKLNDLLRAR